ncbi:ATP synthase epsilon chain [Clostridia bacterium]|nr:ATP synthase epsilon chain [Clostridia bacterium]
MADTFTLRILTPEKQFADEPAEEIIFTTPEGRVGILAHHMSMFAAVAEETIEIKRDGVWKVAAAGQGFAEIFDNKADFYLDTVEWADEIDAVRAREALKRAEERLKHETDHIEYLRTQSSLSRALARIKAAETQSHSQ